VIASCRGISPQLLLIPARFQDVAALGIGPSGSTTESAKAKIKLLHPENPVVSLSELDIFPVAITIRSPTDSIIIIGSQD